MKTEFSSQTNIKLKKLNLPKDIKIMEQKRKIKIDYIQRNTNKKLFKKLKLLEKSYTKNFYGFKFR